MLVIVVVVVLFGVAMLVIVVVVVLFGVAVIVHFAVAMMVFLAVDELIGTGNRGCQLDKLSPVLQVSLGQPQCCLIEVHTVDKDQVGLRQFHGIGGPGLEGMGVGAGRHDGIEVDAITADVVDDICKRQNRNDNAWALFLGGDGSRSRRDWGAGGDEEQDCQERGKSSE